MNNRYRAEVSESIKNLRETLKGFRGELFQSMESLAKAEDQAGIELVLGKAKHVDDLLTRVKSIENDLNLIWADDNNTTEGVVNSTNIKNVRDRTSWRVANGTIKIETKRIDKLPYSNVFPVKLFKEIALSAVDFAEKYTAVKTIDVLNILKNKIISDSDYKKAPRIPVYATFKILVKEGKLSIDPNNSHKYLLAVSKSDMNSWLSTL